MSTNNNCKKCSREILKPSTICFECNLNRIVGEEPCKHLPEDLYFMCSTCKCYHKYLHPINTLDGGVINEKDNHYKDTDTLECTNCGKHFD